MPAKRVVASALRVASILGTAAAAAAAAGGAGAACSSGEPSASAGPGGAVHLTAWTIGPEPTAYTRKTNLIEGARRAGRDLNRPIDIAVDYTTTNHDAYMKKLVFAFAAHRAPDIVCGGHEIVGEFAPPGDLVPLDDLLAGQPAFRDDFFPVLWRAMSWRGRTWAVPQDNEVRLAYVNKDVLRRAGWTDAQIDDLMPRVTSGRFTLDDVAALGEQVVASGAVARGSGVWHRHKVGYDWLQFLLAYGARLEDPASGRLVLSRRATLATLRFFHRLVAGGVTPPGMASYQERTTFSRFVGGDVLMYLTGGSWNKLEWSTAFGLDDAGFRRRIAYFPIPSEAAAGGGAARPPVSISHPFGCAIAATTSDPELAFHVIQRAMDPDLDVGHAIGSSHLVVRQSSSLSAPYRSDPFLQDMIGLLRFTQFAPNHVKLVRLQRVLFDGIRGVEAGILTPEEALDFVIRVVGARLGDDVLVEE